MSKTTQRWQPNSPLRSASNEAEELLCSFDGGVWGSVGPAGLTPRQGGFRHVDKFLAMSSPTCAPKEGERGDDGVGKVCIDSGVFLAVIESRCYTRSLEGHAGFLKLPRRAASRARRAHAAVNSESRVHARRQVSRRIAGGSVWSSKSENQIKSCATIRPSRDSHSGDAASDEANSCSS